MSRLVEYINKIALSQDYQGDITLAIWEDNELRFLNGSFYVSLTPEEAMQFAEWVINSKPKPKYHIKTYFKHPPVLVKFLDGKEIVHWITDIDVEEVW